ncbi:hypothetical protein R6Q57_017630 [Mikania cordata]
MITIHERNLESKPKSGRKGMESSKARLSPIVIPYKSPTPTKWAIHLPLSRPINRPLSAVGHRSSLSTEKRWLVSAFGGIIMCKLSYESTGLVTPFIFKGFIKLNKAQKLEWMNRGFSTFHALFVAIASLYFLLISDLFDENDHEKLMIYRRSTLSEATLGISSGYFLSDMIMILWNYPSLGGLEYVLHHGLSMIGTLQCIFSGEAHYYIFMVLFTESTTPFVNIRWYLDVAGMKSSNLYLWNGIAMFIGWLVCVTFNKTFIVFVVKMLKLLTCKLLICSGCKDHVVWLLFLPHV